MKHTEAEYQTLLIAHHNLLLAVSKIHVGLKSSQQHFQERAEIAKAEGTNYSGFTTAMIYTQRHRKALLWILKRFSKSMQATVGVSEPEQAATLDFLTPMEDPRLMSIETVPPHRLGLQKEKEYT